MTRARDSLTVMVPQRCYVTNQTRAGDRHIYTQRTRFIPDTILDRFEQRTWPETRDLKAALKLSIGNAGIDVRAKMRRRWA
jgi:DNA helicase-2/ATP-dependent DNA helicase PcrA